jgi:hypothetical protein
MTIPELSELLRRKIAHLEKQRVDLSSIGDVDGVVRTDTAIESTRTTLAKLEA